VLDEASVRRHPEGRTLLAFDMALSGAPRVSREHT